MLTLMLTQSWKHISTRLALETMLSVCLNPEFERACREYPGEAQRIPYQDSDDSDDELMQGPQDMI